MKIKANAKINLFLDVLGKRKDGYHNIKTIFQEVSLSDDIFIMGTVPNGLFPNGIKILCDMPGVPTDKKNLVYKAVELLEKHCGIKKAVEIKIKKKIPVGAGLGGGSSDAAAVLIGLNKLWNLKLHKNQLAKIGKKIGADVPFFTYGGGRCLGEGIGDKLTPLKVRKTEWYVLVIPPYQISTKFVYSRLAETKKSDILNKHFNRLEDVVLPLYPEIKKIKDLLIESGAEFSLMSGSGSCVFGLVKNKLTGEKIKNKMKKDGYAVWLVKSI
ncbi:MAG: 4-(cytidine 5'-diphospho)-2-C-methyl-D-erythritol kinase [Elusimicrobiota bacterium]